MEDSKGLSAFFLGLGLGVAVGILFAPKSGEETRHMLRSKMDEGGDYLKRRSEELKDQASEMVDRGRQAVKSQRDQFTAAIDAGKQAYRETVSGTGSAAAEPPMGS
jgi:gas vesicle protein